MNRPDVVPVLVLGGGLTALGVLRSLGERGIPTYTLAAPDALLSRSRWFTPAPLSNGELGTGEGELAAYLRRTPLPRAVLVPCSDGWALQVAQLEAELAARFPSSTASPEAQSTLQDKASFAELLASHDLPHPWTQVVRTEDDLARVPPEIFGNAFLKPCDSQRFFQRYGRKAFRVSGPRDAAERLTEVRAAGFEVVLQEYIPGPASNHYFVDGFVDRGGRIRGLFARRRLRMYPPGFGNSSFMVSVPPAEVEPAIATVRALLAALGYRGIFSAEFKRDERDGRFRILEVNARAWWYLEFAVRCGVDVAGMAYRDALAEPTSEVSHYRVGKRFVYPYYDFYACRALWQSGTLSLGAWLRSWVGAMQPAFRWNDPLPAVSAATRILGASARRRLHLP